ncbi:MAG: hypothetical protein ABIR37_04805 [Candidatus Saccharimonadales bacterium]
MLRSIRTYLNNYWRLSALIIGIILISSLLYGRFLGSLTAGISNEEVQTLASYSSFHAIIDNPLHAPIKVVAWALWHLPFHNPAMLRVPFALFAIFSLVAFAYVLKRWYGVRMAILGVVLFGTSSWLLHVGRIALLDVSFLWGGVTLLALHVLFHAHYDKILVRFGWLIGMLVLLFIPGMVWLVLANLILQRDDLLDSWDEITVLWEKIMHLLLIIITIAGIGLLVYLHPHNGLDWLGAPRVWSDWQGMLKRLGNDIAYFVARGPHHPALWLGRLPILDAFTTIMLVAGLYFYGRHLRSFRTVLITVLLSVAALLIAVSGTVSIALLVPFVYAIIVGGMAYVLHHWLQVFPRNPLARGLGVGLIALLVAASSAYNLRSYFVAWPHNSETRATFIAVLPGIK